MLYIVGLGLGNEKDITLRGLETVKRCDKVYMEAYTSLLSFGLSPDGLSALEDLYGRSVIVADREMVEEKADCILFEASRSDVAFLVVGDPFGATTHTDLVVRANKLGVKVKIVHNASVMNAVGVCGLQLYRYGETVSIPFFTETWRPDSFYEKIRSNRENGLHTLCLLDIRVKEPSIESLARGRKCYEPPKYMTVQTAIEQLLEVEQLRSQNGRESFDFSNSRREFDIHRYLSNLQGLTLMRLEEEDLDWKLERSFNTDIGEALEQSSLLLLYTAYGEETKCVGIARLGSEDQMIVVGSMKELLDVNFGAPLHCLVIVGNTHELEEEMLEFYSVKSTVMGFVKDIKGLRLEMEA